MFLIVRYDWVSQSLFDCVGGVITEEMSKGGLSVRGSPSSIHVMFAAGLALALHV